MSDTSRTSGARSGARYLLVLGWVGALIAVYFVMRGLAEIWQGHFLQGGFASLVFGGFYGAAAVRVLKLGREARTSTKRPLADR